MSAKRAAVRSWVGPVDAPSWDVADPTFAPKVVTEVLFSKAGIPKVEFCELTAFPPSRDFTGIRLPNVRGVLAGEKFLGVVSGDSKKYKSPEQVFAWMDAYTIERGSPVYVTLLSEKTILVEYTHGVFTVGKIPLRRAVVFFSELCKPKLSAAVFHLIQGMEITVQGSAPVGLVEHTVWNTPPTLQQVTTGVKTQFSELENVYAFLASVPYSQKKHQPILQVLFGAPESAEERMAWLSQSDSMPFFIQAIDQAMEYVQDFQSTFNVTTPPTLLDLYICAQKIILGDVLLKSKTFSEDAEMTCRLSGKAAHKAAEILRTFATKMAG